MSDLWHGKTRDYFLVANLTVMIVLLMLLVVSPRVGQSIVQTPPFPIDPVRIETSKTPTAITANSIDALVRPQPIASPLQDAPKSSSINENVVYATNSRRMIAPEKTNYYFLPMKKLEPRFNSQLPNSRRRNRINYFDKVIARAAQIYHLDRFLIKAVIHAESYFDPEAVSRAGAQGLMQIMPDTAAELDLENPFQPVHNIMSGSRMLARLLNKYNNNLDLALAAYNAGEGAVSKYNGIPPYDETQMYVEKVKRWKNIYRIRASIEG